MPDRVACGGFYCSRWVGLNLDFEMVRCGVVHYCADLAGRGAHFRRGIGVAVQSCCSFFVGEKDIHGEPARFIMKRGDALLQSLP